MAFLKITSLKDDLGYFNGTYVNLDTFWIGKGAAGPDIHKVKYHFIDTTNRAYWNISDSSVCWLYDSLNVLVAPLDSIYIDTLGPLCLNAPIQAIIATPPGGIFKDSSGATLDSFLASNYGVGTHLITYTYIDSNGCRYTTQTWVQVTEAPHISFGFDSTYCIPAYGMAVWAKYNTLEFPDLKYLWSNGDTTKNSRYHCGDTLVLYTYTADSTCFSIDTFVNELQCCCDLPNTINPEDNLAFSHENQLLWNEQILVIDRDITIKDTYTSGLIDDCTIIMKNCARIIVEGGAQLTIERSAIGFCEWEGIEVQGQYDACSNDFTEQGKLIINTTQINSANVGIMLGARDYTIDARFAYQLTGGVVEADDCHFIGNYVDVLITPWTWAGICICADPNGKEWHTYFKNCDFDTLANDYICDPFVNVILDSLNAYHDYTSPGVPKYCNPNMWGFWGANFDVQSRCHIIDLSPYIDYWINRPGSGINCWDACAHNSWQGPDDITDPFPFGNPNSYSGRTFDGTIIDCDQIAPNSNHD